MFDAIAERVEVLLKRTDSDSTRPLRNSDAICVRQWARITQKLYAYLRYLQVSDPSSSPPGIQSAISDLVNRHVPVALTCSPEEIVALVRPQWEYNHKFIALTRLLDSIEVADLDPLLELLPDSDDESVNIHTFIAERWSAKKLNGQPPRHMAVLSFAGIDRDDVLSYPLLAHEIGHFIDFAYPGTIHANPALQPERWSPTEEELATLTKTFGSLEDLALFQQLRLRAITRARTRVTQLVEQCLRELTADLLAARMIGLPFFVALGEFLKLTEWLDHQVVKGATGYPGAAFRLRTVLDELTLPEGGVQLDERLAQALGPRAEAVLAYLSRWREHLAGSSPERSQPKDLEGALANLAAERILGTLPDLRALIRKIVPATQISLAPERLSMMIDLLVARVPPFPAIAAEGYKSDITDLSFAEVLTAGWIYQICQHQAQDAPRTAAARQHAEYQNTCLLLFKAIELNNAKAAIERFSKSEISNREDVSPDGGAGGGVASGPSIREAIKHASPEKRLMLVPYFGEAPLQSASWDIHLGNWFKFARRTNYASVDLADPDERAKALREGQEEVYVRFDGQFVLHPGDFALGVSLEYVAIPGTLMGFVEGKSSLGRAGLIIATAAQVAPGFKGCIVLELFNAGRIPLVLRPGMRIAQLVFHTTDRHLTSEWLYGGTFRCQVKP